MSSPFSLEGKSILITGASSGIGKAVSILAASLGARCCINGRNIERLQETLDSLPGEGHVCLPGSLDEKGAEEIVETAVSRLGPLHGFVHCAGIEKTLPFRVATLEDLREVFAVNVEAFWLLAQQLLRRGKHAAAGVSVVSIGSVTAEYGTAGTVAYAASKGALVSMVKSLAAEYAPQKIRFNCVCPGYVNTPMLNNLRRLYPSDTAFDAAIVQRHPLGIGKPENVADAVAFLLSDASSWVTGTTMQVDGGYGVR